MIYCSIGREVDNVIPVVGLYTSMNIAARCLVYLFNFLSFRSKSNVIGRGTIFFTKSISNKARKRFVTTLLVLGEIFIISFAQYRLSTVNGAFGELVGTEANYFGKLLFSPVFVAFFCLILGIDVFKQMDIITPAFPLALAASKFGCFCAGCCHGIVSYFGLYNHKTDQTEFPSQLLEMALAVGIFIFLTAWKKKAKEGTVFPIYLILYSSTRFFSEFTRSEENVFLFLKIYHILCLIGIVAGVLLLIFIKKYKEKIRQFYNNYFDATEDILTEIAKRIGIKRKNEIVHHKNKKRKKVANAQSSVKTAKITSMKKWIIIWTLGLIGQIGWNVEGTWFNTFVYEKIDKTPSIITPMLILSALATTVSILLFGTLTDRTGNRRRLISSGFVLWGILFICFGANEFIAKTNLTVSIISVIIMDMLLSFFGSMSTDVGYSTWLTDIMNDSNRGQIGGAIAIQVVLGSLLGNVLGGYIVGAENNYLRFFIVTGSLFSLLGAISVFLFDKKDDAKPSVKGSFFNQFSELFKLKTILKNKEFMLVNLAVAIFFTGYNIYFPHLGNLLTQYMGYSAKQMGLIKAVPMIFAMIATMPVSKIINKSKYIEVTLVSVTTGLIGLLSVFSITPENVDTNKTFNLRLFFAIFLVAVSYIIMLQTTKTWTKNLHPTEMKGQFEGLWAISFAFIPAVIGSNIGEWVVKNSGVEIFNDVAQRYEYIPNGKVFLVGAIISTFSFIPIVIAKKYTDKDRNLTQREKNKSKKTESVVS